MGSQTPVYALPYPLGTDLIMHGDDDIKALAERIEVLLAQRDAQSGRRNVIRNGDLGVAQRGNGPFVANGYTVDGWTNNASGSPTLSTTRATLPPASAPQRYALAAAIAAAASLAGDYAFVEQRIEDVRTLAGRQVTLAFDASSSVAGRSVGVSMVQRFGTGGAPSADVNTNVVTKVLSAGLTRYVVTFTVPSIAGKSIGTNENSSLSLMWWLAAGSNTLAQSGLGSAGAQGAFAFTLTDVQLEGGAVATPFERLPQQQQLAWCQRYFVRMSAPASGYAFGVGVVLTAGQAEIVLPFPQTMRAAPTFTVAAMGGLTVYDSTQAPPVAGWASSPMTPEKATVNPQTSPANLTPGRAGSLYNNGALCMLDFNAEL